MTLSLDLYLALLAFCFVMTGTPGPNNMMLMASGANFGYRRSLPHIFGIAFGVIVMVTTVGAGLGRVFELYPMIEVVLKWVSLVYLGWLALKIARAGTPQARVVATPMSFLAAAAFQWVNPKAWGMALSAIAAYAPDHSLAGALVVALTFGAVGPPTVSLWCLLGVRLREFLTSPARLKAFNWTMAALLILSTLPVLFH